MKKYVKNYNIILSLIGSIVFLIIGAVMYTKPDFIVLFFSYIVGGIIIILGFYNCIKNYIEVKKDNQISSKGMIIGIVLIVVGLIFIFLAEVIESLVRLIIGGYILFIGIIRLINALTYKKKTWHFVILICISLLLIGGGLYTILEVNLAFQAMGIIIMIYAALDIIGFVFNKPNKEITKTVIIDDNKVLEATLITEKSKKKK